MGRFRSPDPFVLIDTVSTKENPATVPGFLISYLF